MSYSRQAFFAPAPTTERGRAVHIGGDPKGVNFLYTNGRNVIIRNLKNPEIAAEYTQHTAQTTVARYSPSGFYIASADVQGNIRIWDTQGAEQIIKTETRPFAGKINDLAWDFESKRIIAVGEGKDRFGHAFLFDTASSCGEIAGHSKAINSITIRPSRPLRAVTASDDLTVNFYHGVPYKFNKSLSHHSRFVQCVRYSPNGEHFVSAGSDGKLFLYDGLEGKMVSELSTSENCHTGGIFSVSWSPDSLSLLTASADMTSKIWDVKTNKVVSTFNISEKPTFEDQQVGSLWQGDTLMTLSLSGNFNYLDAKSGTIARVVKGHQRGITALNVSEKTIWSGSYDGRVCAWEDGNGSASMPGGAGHNNQITDVVVSSGKVFTAGMDDTIRTIDPAKYSGASFSTQSVATEGLPRSIAAHQDTVICVTSKSKVMVMKGDAIAFSLSVDFNPLSAAISPCGKLAAIGSEDNKVYVYKLSDDGKLSSDGKLESNRGQVTAVSFSPDGKWLAAADTDRKVLVYDVATKKLSLNEWQFHTARVNSITWAPDSLHAASGSLDTNVEVWSVEKPLKHISIKNAHLETVSGTAFLDNNTLATAGGDAIIKIWKLSHHQG